LEVAIKSLNAESAEKKMKRDGLKPLPYIVE
jgi:hypothetical protein